MISLFHGGTGSGGVMFHEALFVKSTDLTKHFGKKNNG